MASWNVHAVVAIVVIMVSGALMVDINEVDCENLKLICDDEIFQRIFTNATVTVSENCCTQLGYAGRGCLEGWVKTDLEDPFYKNHTTLAQEILAKTEQVWNNCTPAFADDCGSSSWPWWSWCV